jgi:branched-chain amino acid transport system substrate-binding protein
MKKVILISVVAMLLGCVVADTDDPATGVSNDPDSQAVRIGALIPLSGKKTPIGIQQRQTFELARERLKAEHGVNVDFIFEDTRSDAKAGEMGARKLINDQGVSLILAFPCAIVYKTQPIADKAGALLMACNMDPLTAEQSTRTFRAFPNLRQQSDTMLGYLDKGGGKRVAIIRLKAPSPDQAVAELLPALKGKGFEVVADITYEKEARNYEAIVGRIKSAGPDIILTYLDNEAVPPLLKLLKKEKSLKQTKIVGGISFAFSYKLSPEILEGVIVAAPSCVLSGRSRVASSWFGTEFKRRYDKPPHMFAAFCFDSAMLIGHAIKERGSSPADVEAYLKTVRNYPGVTGSITIDKAGDAEVAWDIGIYRNGKLIPIEQVK